MKVQLTLALRYLRGRRLRSALTTLAVALGVTVVFAFATILPTMTQAFRQNMLASAGQVDVSVVHETGSTFGPEVLETVATTPGIAQATGLLRRSILLPTPLQNPANLLDTINALTLAGVDTRTFGRVRAYSLVAGRFLEEGDRYAMVIPEDLARRAGLAIGDRLVLPAATGQVSLEIVGIVTARVIPGAIEVYVPLPTAQEMLNLPEQYSDVEALLVSGAERAQVQAEVRRRLGAGYSLEGSAQGSEFLASLQLGELAVGLFGFMALVMGGFIILNTFRTVVAERRRDLGMLRAVGASRGMIVGLILAEGAVQGLVGALLGMLAGYGLAAGMLAVVSSFARELLRLEISAPVPTAAAFVEALVLGLGMTLLGGLLPALSAGRVPPLEALRPQLGAPLQRANRRRAIAGLVLIVLALVGLLSGVFNLVALGTLLFLIGMVLVIPALIRPISKTFGRLLGLIFAREGRLAQGNMARQPGRAAITASALMVGLAILIALLGMVSSIREGFLTYLDRSLGADFLVMPTSLVLGGGNVGAVPELAASLRQTPGIAAVTTLRAGTTRTKGAALQVVGIDPETYPQVAGLEFKEGNPDEAYAALGRERAIIVNGIFAAQNGVRPGDVLTLQTPRGERDYRVVGIGLDYLNAKMAVAYISQANLAEDLRQTNDLLLMANMEPGADVDAVRAAVQSLIADYPSFTLLDSASFRRSQEGFFDQALILLYAMAALLALPGLLAIVNTLAINVIERRREIGLLRAVGSTQRQVGRMILAESLLLAGAGTALGILVGLWFSYVLVGALNESGFLLHYHFPAAGLLAAVAVGLLFGILAALIPARQAARLEIVEALRYE